MRTNIYGVQTLVSWPIREASMVPRADSLQRADEARGVHLYILCAAGTFSAQRLSDLQHAQVPALRCAETRIDWWHWEEAGRCESS